MCFSLMLTAKGMKWTRFYQTIIFIPVTLAILVTGYPWKLILNPQWGALPLMLKSIGLESLVKPWLGEQQYALTALSLVSSWQWVGIPAMMILAGLQTIPDDLLEAADLIGTLFYRVGIAGQHPVGIPNPGMGAAIATVTFIMLMVGVGIMLRLTQGGKD